ncbi:MAG: restriction endonuclease subunit S [Deltaproteobacteria bacterium]|nr:restriction endonuclease subunit S [Deltaproteobacteria bacterium]
MKLRKDKWEEVKLKDVCEAVNTVNACNQNGTFRYIDIGSIDSNLKRISEVQELDWSIASSRARQIIKQGDTLFSTVRVNLERIAFVENDIPNGIASTGFTVIRANEKAHPEYLFYSTSSPKFIEKLCLLQKGTAYPAVSDKIVFNEEIPLPPLEEQKQIAALFQSIDTALEEVERQEKNLLNLKNKLLGELCGEKQQFGNALSKSDFETVKFDKVAISISERIEPQKTDLTTYVGLEHLDPDNLVITRTGVPDDVIGTKLKIYTGDIMFGKRRAYQRKVAVSHFDGIASAHSMILRANSDNIEKEFLPFFMQSDVFMNRAIQISEGSLSPTIKWKTLAAQEFSLPKKAKQKELTAVFKQFGSVRTQLEEQKTTLQHLKQKLLSEILG